MDNMPSGRMARGDEENTAFGLPARFRERKPGYVREAAAYEERAGEHRRRPSEDSDIPQESLAARIAKRRKEG